MAFCYLFRHVAAEEEVPLLGLRQTPDQASGTT